MGDWSFLGLAGLNLFREANMFLLVLGFVWLTVASISDLRKREVENWWSFSLIAFALAYRAFLSVESESILPLAWGLFGLILGFILASLFYYGRMFAGGDFKLLLALGVILPIADSFRANITLFILFLVLLLFAGGLYGIAYSVFLMLANYTSFRKEFTKLSREYRISLYSGLALGIIAFIILYFFDILMALCLGLIIVLTPILLIFAKAVEKGCLNKLVSARELTIGDWLVKNVKLGKRTIKPNWEGLSEEELGLLKKYKGKIIVKYGIPFVPVFLIAFIALITLIYDNIL